MLNCHTAHIACLFAELKEKIDHCSRKKLEDAPKCLKSGDAATVDTVPGKSICVGSFSDLWMFLLSMMRDREYGCHQSSGQEAAGASKVTKSAQEAEEAKTNGIPNTCHSSHNQWRKNGFRTICLN